MEERILGSQKNQEENEIERNLRPLFLNDYIGQHKIKESLGIYIQAAKERAEALDHVLLFGPPGLGKTTLANIISYELKVQIQTTSGPAVERPGDLAAVLTNLNSGDVLFIDEMHRLNPAVEEVLYPAMEDYSLDIVIGKGPSARTIRLDLPKFTLVGATTRAGLLTSPLRERFGIVLRLDFYSTDELAEIVKRSSKILDIPIDPEGALEIARRSRGTPRIANRLLKRVRDYAQILHEGNITLDVADSSLRKLEVDKLGLDSNDRRMLTTIIEKFEGGPVGLDTISAAINEEADTVEDIYEPFLLQLGFIQRTPRGRVATPLAYKHLDFKGKKGKQITFDNY